MGRVDTLMAQAKAHGFTEEEAREALALAEGGLVDYWHTKPVGIEEFITSPHYLRSGDEVYPPVMEELKAITEGDYQEAVLTGAIGSAKTSVALWLMAYGLYELSCMSDPHGVFELARWSEITIIFQNITKELAKAADYSRFQSMIERAPYFQEHFPFDKEIKSELRFPNRIIVKPVSGAETASIGQNIIFGTIDEMNYMQTVEKSKNSVDGGTYDQAVAVYNSLARRRKSRFMSKGKLPGILCLVSSKRYPGQFTDIKMAEAKTDKTIYVYDKRVWDIKPHQFSGVWFDLFLGDEFRKPRILSECDTVTGDDLGLVRKVPIEYRVDFETDIMAALRDIAGESTLAIHPFMPDADAVSQGFGKTAGVMSSHTTDFHGEAIHILKDRIKGHKHPRFCHIDLATTGDSAGLCVGHVPRFVDIIRPGGERERLPEIVIDLSLEIKPPPGGEILFYRIRNILIKLREMGLNMTWCSLDSFQSVDTIQVLRQQGLYTGKISIDTDNLYYELTKAALYDGRVLIPEHPKLLRELRQLERDVKRDKIDHPATATGSKDVADALAGVVGGLMLRSDIWALHNVTTFNLPSSVQTALNNAQDKLTGST